jgi:hypothetical protein
MWIVILPPTSSHKKHLVEGIKESLTHHEEWHLQRRGLSDERYTELKERFELEERTFGKDGKRFFKHFIQSTFEGSQAAARIMKKIEPEMFRVSQFVSSYSHRLGEASMAQQSTSRVA